MNLDKYSDTIPDELTLGYIGWYTLYDPKISHADLVAAATGVFDDDLIPGEPRIGDAFKRACRNAEQKGLPIPHIDQFANVLFRKVSTSNDEIEQHIVIEVVDKKGKALSYHDAARLTFDRTANALHVDKLSIPQHLDSFRDLGFDAFVEKFQEARTQIEPQVIRLMFRQQLRALHAVNVRQSGSVYFLPQFQKERVKKLEKFFDGFNNESEFHTVALMDNTKQRRMVQKAFDGEIHERAEALIADVMAMKERDSIPPKKFEKMKEEYNTLRKQRKEYQELLEWNELKADTELSVLDKRWSELLTGS